MSIHTDAADLVRAFDHMRDLNMQLSKAEQLFERLAFRFVALHGPRYGSNSQVIAGSPYLVIGDRLFIFTDNDFGIGVRICPVAVVESGFPALPAPSNVETA